MSDRSAIEWTDATWNPVTGCTKVSPGCKFCYAERITQRRGADFSEVALHADRLDQPLHWRQPRRVFVNSMSDLFHEDVPLKFIWGVLGMVVKAPQHMYQILTKRAYRMREIVTDWYDDTKVVQPFPNLWFGVSAEDQYRANERIPLLLQTPAAIRFVSLEPLLGPIDLRPYFHPVLRGHPGGHGLPPESGGPPERALIHRQPVSPFVAHVKPEALQWVRLIRDQCGAAGVPFFFKQWGGPTPKSGGRLLDGRTWDEMPEPAAMLEAAARRWLEGGGQDK